MYYNMCIYKRVQTILTCPGKESTHERRKNTIQA
jgi:hypothetical protein